MRPHTTHKGKSSAHKGQAGIMPPAMVNELVALYGSEQWAPLELNTRTLVQRYPHNPLGWRVRGKALLKLGRHADAQQALRMLTKLAPQEAEAFSDLGVAYQFGGQLDLAEKAFRQALGLKADCLEALGNLGILMATLRRFDEALALQRRCVALAPNVAAIHNNLGSALRDAGQPLEAVACFSHALTLAPHYTDAWLNLGTSLFEQQQIDQALQAYRQALVLQPDSEKALTLLGRVLGQLGQDLPQAIALLEKATALNPGNADAWLALGNVLLVTGPAARCHEVFRHALSLRPLISWPARKQPAEFSVLVLDTPGAGSTPVDYLMGGANYDTHFYCVMPGQTHDLDMLRSKADIVLNIISDADSGAGILPLTQALIDQLARPTLNAPAQIGQTDRATTAARLAHLGGCHMPLTRHIDSQALLQAAQPGRLEGFELPLLVRRAGNHGGDAMAKLDNWEAVQAYAQAHAGEPLYVTAFVDYRSSDGLYRKYRLINIDGQLWPYHLAIHDDWLVHHFRTDMAQQAWKRQEELAFLANPQQVFNPEQMSTLQAIAASTGLDYCGIDCALDHQGRVLVFEVNATMLVHDEKGETFAYKNPYVGAIRQAFNTMLAQRASSSRMASITPL